MISIKHIPLGDVCLFEIDGRLDSMSASKFQSTILHAAHKGICQNIILDMQAVDYLSAAGLRVLNELRDVAGQVHIARPSQRVREVLQITGLDVAYSVHYSPTDALHQLQPMVNGYMRLDEGWQSHLAPPLTGMDYFDWRDQYEDEHLAKGDELYAQYGMTAIASGLREMIANGTTSVLEITRDGKSIAPLARSDLRGLALFEVAGTHPEQIEHHFNTLRMRLEQYRPRTNSSLKIGIAIAGLHAVHPELLEKVVTYAKMESLPVAISIAQTLAEVAYIEAGEGELLSRYYGDDNPPVPSPRKSMTAYMEDLGLLAIKPILIHATHLNDDDIQQCAQAECQVVHTPRSDMRLRNGRMRLEKMLAQGMHVCLGTGSRARVPDYNLNNEIATAIALHYGKVEPEQVASLVGNV
jgi:anti-anti-sigma factor